MYIITFLHKYNLCRYPEIWLKLFLDILLYQIANKQCSILTDQFNRILTSNWSSFDDRCKVNLTVDFIYLNRLFYFHQDFKKNKHTDF